MTVRSLERILVLSNLYYPHHRGGYELRCRSVADELRRRGYDIRVLTSTARTSSEEPDRHPILRRLHIAEPASAYPLVRHWGHLRWACVSRLDYRTTCRVLADVRPQLVYVWNMGRMSLSPVHAAQRTGAPLVFDVGDYWLLRRYEELEREANPLKKRYRLAVHAIPTFQPSQFEHILTNSRVLKQRHVEAGFPAGHIRVIPRGMEPDRIADALAPVPPAGKGLRLLYAGRVVEEKGAHVAIEAVARIRPERPVSLQIIGDGDAAYLARLQTQARSLGVEDAVSFRPAVSQAALFELYRQVHAVVVPSVWVEPFGGIVLEAMAQGTCVIASDRGGPAEIITNGRDGILVEPENPAALAQAVADLAAQPQRMEQLRTAALQTVQQHYRLDRIVDRVEAHLKGVYQQPRQ